MILDSSGVGASSSDRSCELNIHVHLRRLWFDDKMPFDTLYICVRFNISMTLRDGRQARMVDINSVYPVVSWSSVCRPRYNRRFCRRYGQEKFVWRTYRCMSYDATSGVSMIFWCLYRVRILQSPDIRHDTPGIIIMSYILMISHDKVRVPMYSVQEQQSGLAQGRRGGAGWIL